LQRNAGGAETIRLDKETLSANVNAGKSTNEQTNPIKTDKKRYHAPLKNCCDVELVNFKIGKLGVDIDHNSCCVKAAMFKGLINLTGNSSDLEHLIIEGNTGNRHKYKVYLKHILYQPDYGGTDYENGASESPVICICCSNRVQGHKSLKDDADKDGKYADKQGLQ